MKKLVMMCVAVAVACVANAAAIQWGSGNIYLSDGTTKAGKDDVTAILWESTSSTAFSSLSAADLYAAKDNPSSITGYAKSQNTTALGAVNLKSGTSYASGTDVYSAILYINNKEGGYIANFGQATAGTAQVNIADMSIYSGGSLNGTPNGPAIGGWTGGGTQPDIPEPTSALLLLMGGAMLALRRKQK